MDLGRGFGDGAFFGVDFFFCALLAFQVARSARVQFSLGSYSCVSGVANERGGVVTQVGSYGLPVSGSVPAHATRYLLPFLSRISSASHNCCSSIG